MELNFIDLTTIKGHAKATIHVTGKLGMSSAAVKLMRITERARLFKVATESTQNDTLYLVPTESGMNSIQACKAGNHYYFNLANAFSDLGYDYKNNRISFLIETVQWERVTIYKLTVKTKTKR